MISTILTLSLGASWRPRSPCAIVAGERFAARGLARKPFAIGRRLCGACFASLARMANHYEPASQLLAADRARVADIMTRGAISVRDDFGLEQVVELLLDQNISQVPVVDEAGRLVGIVSKTDLVIDQHEGGDTAVSQAGSGGRGRHVHEVGGLVRDVMTPIVVALDEATTIGEAARRLLADNIHAVPITDRRGNLVGILSATDIVAWVAGAAPFPQVAVAPAPHA
jgi:CBS domain-containing protein